MNLRFGPQRNERWLEGPGRRAQISADRLVLAHEDASVVHDQRHIPYGGVAEKWSTAIERVWTSTDRAGLLPALRRSHERRPQTLDRDPVFERLSMQDQPSDSYPILVRQVLDGLKPTSMQHENYELARPLELLSTSRRMADFDIDRNRARAWMDSTIGRLACPFRPRNGPPVIDRCRISVPIQRDAVGCAARVPEPFRI